MKQRDRTIETADGIRLAATTYEPAGAPEAAVVINSALAVGRGFYRAIAAWFARHGVAVLTYDCRGMGESASGEIADCEATIGDWVDHDIPAAIEWTRDRFGADDLYVFGHSLGGQLTGLVGDRCPVDGLVTFSAQSGYWRLQYPGEEWKLLVTMTVLVPAVTRLLGYLPWSAVFGGEDIPGPVARQWARWCRDPEYLMGDPSLDAYSQFERFTAPVLAYSFDDDEWGYREAVDWMMDQYVASDVERLHVVPREVGVESIGHFGFFRPEMEHLWEDLRGRLRTM